MHLQIQNEKGCPKLVFSVVDSVKILTML